jgi:hypothetical protein
MFRQMTTNGNPGQVPSPGISWPVMLRQRV